MKDISVNLFICVYTNIPFLKKVLDSVEQQVYKNFTVTIVEDGNFEEMKTFVENYTCSFSILHLQQEDQGFRKNKILNAGLRKNKAEQESKVENNSEDLIDKKIRGLKIALKVAIKGEEKLIEKRILALEIAKKMSSPKFSVKV